MREPERQLPRVLCVITFLYPDHADPCPSVNMTMQFKNLHELDKDPYTFHDPRICEINYTASANSQCDAVGRL